MSFSKPDIPEPPAPIVTPTSASEDIYRSTMAARKKLAKRRGRMSTILSKDYNDNSRASDILGA